MKEFFKLWDSQDKKVIEVEAKKVGKEWKALCPKHPDKKASLLINKEKEVYNCFGCPFKGHLYNPTQKLTSKPKKKAQEKPIPINYKKMEERAKEYQGDIPQGIKEARGLTDEIIEKFQIGYAKYHWKPEWRGHKNCLTIPIKKDKKIVNIRYHSLEKDANPKILPYQTGLPFATWLYPQEQLDNDTLIFSEGELDALCCISHGLPAITRTCGATTWKPEFNKYFRYKTVYIIQDCDKPGREGALKIAQELVKIAKEIRVINLGLAETKELKGQDLTDWFVTYEKSKEELLKVIQKTPVYTRQSLPGSETLREKEKPNKKPSKREFNPRPYSNEILREYSLKFDKYKRFWLYDKEAGIWRGEADLILDSTLRKKILGTDDYKRYCVGEILADLRGLTYQQEPPEEPEPHLIPFNNTIYDLKNDKFLDYNPDYFFTNKLAVTLNEEHRKCLTIDTEIFEKIVPTKDIITLYEIIAYCLWRGYPYPKMFFLYGSGRNGKGVFVKILRRLLGENNYSQTDSSALQYDKFASSNLFGKLANISGEMEYTILKKTTKIKQLTGEDSINCEAKFKHPFPFVNYAKMIFLTNQVPLTMDKTIAFYDRIFLLEFPHYFIAGKDADPLIVEKLPEEEIEGLAWHCLNDLRELRERDFVFTNNEKVEATTKKYEDLSNPLNKFLEEFTEREPNSDIAVADFAETYLSYLKNKGFRLWTNKEIKKAMDDKGFRQKPLGGTQTTPTYRAWIELKWQ